MGVRAWRAEGKGLHSPPKKNGQFAVFLGNDQNLGRRVFGISNIALIHIEMVYMSILY